MTTMIEAGLLVRGARRAAGMTQAELARRVGTSQSTVDKIERGCLKRGGSFLAEIAIELDIPVDRVAYISPPSDGAIYAAVSRRGMMPGEWAQLDADVDQIVIDAMIQDILDDIRDMENEGTIRAKLQALAERKPW